MIYTREYLTKNVIRKLLTSLNKLLKSEPARNIKNYWINMLPYTFIQYLL